MAVYSVVVIEHPTKKDKDDNDTDERIVFGPVCIVAKSLSQAGTKAILQNTSLLSEADPERLEVLVVPFQ
jgi:hypothetical protein